MILYGDLIDGGFDGLRSETPIHGVEFINGQSAYFDDLHFVSIPAPGVGMAFGVAGLGVLARQRRRAQFGAHCPLRPLPVSAISSPPR